MVQVRRGWLPVVAAGVLAVLPLTAQGNRAQRDALKRGEWRDYAGDSLAAKYSPLDQTNFVYAFDRRTGKPVWPIVERPVPQAKTANRERTSPTQLFPTKPPAIDLQGSVPENMMDFTPALRARALENLQQFEGGPLFTPPSEKGTLVLPGSLGGPNWGGAAFDPETGIYYVPTRTTTSTGRAPFPTLGAHAPAATPTAGAPAPGGGYGQGAGAGQGQNAALYVDGLPIFKAPYAKVTAINMNRGEIQWATPIGNGPRSHPALTGLNLPPLGDPI